MFTLWYFRTCFYNTKTNIPVGILFIPLIPSLPFPVCLNEYCLTRLPDIIQKITTSELCGLMVLPKRWKHLLRFYLKEMKKILFKIINSTIIFLCFQVFYLNTCICKNLHLKPRKLETEFRSETSELNKLGLSYTTQKIKFSIEDFFSKCDQIRHFRRIWSHLLMKFLMENFIFCAVSNILAVIDNFIKFSE